MGKYIKKFDTHSDYEDFIETEDFIRPNVSYCVDNKDVHYNSTQTLFALEIESGRFISFYFLSGTLYGNTDDGSSALWVLDDDGVVIDNISIYGAERAPILEQINEHYGTSFTGWSDNEIGLRFGDSLPNWNAYEKIEMPLNLSALIPFNETRYIAIDVFNGESGTIMCSGNSPMLINESKVFVSPGPPFSAGEEKAKEFILEHYSINITNWSANNQSLSPGSTIPNSEKYIIMD